MKHWLTVTFALLLVTITVQGQALNSKQAHTLLDNIVMGSRGTLNSAQVSVVHHKALPGGITVRAFLVKAQGMPAATYVASYGTDDRLIDGMLVATEADVRRLRAEPDNEFVWFAPQGEAQCSIFPDSVLVTRRYNLEMKPLGHSYTRYCCTATSPYVINADGTFRQLPMTFEDYRIDGMLDENLQELPPSSQKKAQPSHNALSAQVMHLLHSPISKAEEAMEEWMKLGDDFSRRLNMTGVPESDSWSISYYANNTGRMLTQGDGRKMVWFYQHFGSGPIIDAMALLYGKEYNLAKFISSTDNDESLPNLLHQAIKRLNDKKARQWWKEALKHYTPH
ncbi:MAG: hypothetical protein IJ632_00625 [Muribaculaceae bacterium]|nr:hypothetical protein [Muribaculaceae bacterium]